MSDIAESAAQAARRFAQENERLTAQLAATERARDLLAGSLAREQAANGRLRAANTDLRAVLLDYATDRYYYNGEYLRRCCLCHDKARNAEDIRHTRACVLHTATTPAPADVGREG